MGRLCACCASPRRPEIDTAIVASATAKAIAATVGLKATQVSRHRRICLQAAPLSDADQLKLLMGRSEELWAMAAGNGDVRAMAQALQSSLRALEFQIRHHEEEAQAQTARDLPHNTQLWTPDEGTKFIAYMDWVLQTTKMPTVEEYAAYSSTRFGGEKHEHDRLPIRN